VLRQAQYQTLQSASPIQFTPSRIYLRFILIYTSHLRLGFPSGLLRSGLLPNLFHVFLLYVYPLRTIGTAQTICRSSQIIRTPQISKLSYCKQRWWIPCQQSKYEQLIS